MPPWKYCYCCGKLYYPWNIDLKSEHKKVDGEETTEEGE